MGLLFGLLLLWEVELKENIAKVVNRDDFLILSLL